MSLRDVGGRAAAWKRLRWRARDESGQSLIIAIAGLLAILAIAAFAIDVASWYQKHHQAQVAADGAALAAANCMAYAGQTVQGVVNTCTSASDTTPDAQAVATSYASRNGIAIPSSDVSFNNSTVTVTTPAPAADYFASVFGIVNTQVVAKAAATWKNSDCSSTGSRCAFIFANDDVCSGNTGVTGTVANNSSATIGRGVTITKSGASGSVTGGVISDASIFTSLNGNGSWSAEASNPNQDSGGNTCTTPNTAGQSDPYSGTSPRTVPSTWPNDWPIDYRTTYPACSASGTVTCDVGGFPSYCTQSVESTASTLSLSTTVANAVYCDAGTGASVNKADPSTWTGQITQTSGGSGSTVAATYISGSVIINLPSNTTMTPASGNNLLAYAAECNPTYPSPPGPCTSISSTSPVVQLNTNGNSTIQGDVFAPAGTIDGSFAGNPAAGAFLEGWDVVYNANGNVFGGGPTVNSGGQLVLDFLVQ